MKTTKVLETNITETNINEVSKILNFHQIIVLQFAMLIHWLEALKT